MQPSTPMQAVSISRVFARHWFALLVIAVVLPVALSTAATRPLWLDEILTYHVLQGGGLSDLWHRLATGSQADPPLFYLAARASIAVFGDTSAAFRLPSLLGILIAGLALYTLICRVCSPAYARLALLFSLFPPVLDHFANARPYGLWVACSALALLCWQLAGDTTGWRRGAAVLALAFCSAASVATHYYAVLFLAALGGAQLVRCWTTRRVDAPVWLALGSAVPVLVAMRPLIENAKSFVTGSWAAPNLTFDPHRGLLGVLRALFADRLHLAAFLAVGLIALVARFWPRGKAEEVPAAQVASRNSLFVAAVAVCSIPLLGFVLAKLYTNNYNLRYVLPAACGMALMAPLTAHWLARGRAWPAHLGTTAVSAMLVYFCAAHMAPPLHSLPRVWETVQETDQRATESGAVMVTSRLHVFIEGKFYHPELRLLYVCLAPNESSNQVARRMRPYYDGILEPEQLKEQDQMLIVGDRAVSGSLIGLIEKNKVPFEEQRLLRRGKGLYLVRGRSLKDLDLKGLTEPATAVDVD